MVIGNASNEAMAGDTTIPNNNNQLTNGQNFITAASVPDVNDGTLTISLNGTDTTFSANQSGNSSVSITTGDSDNFYVTGASYTADTLTLTRNGGLADVTANGFLQVGTTSSDALAGNTVTITSAQATAINDNSLKTSFPGFGVTSTTALRGDTTTITSAQATEINANTAKTGITTAQATEISDNTLKTSFPGFGTTSTTALRGDTVIPPPAPVDSVNGQTGAVTLTTITPAQTNEIAANTLKTSMVLGTAANEALAGNTPLLQIGTTSTTALAGDTFIPRVKGYTGSIQFMDCKGECLEMVIDNGLIVEINGAER